MAGDDQEGAGRKPAFDYATHFGNIQTLGELLRDPAHRPWLTSVPEERPEVEHVVWLGCNILRTTHLAQSLEDLLQHLRLDFVMLGGPSACCGIIHNTHGAVNVSRNMLKATVGKFEAFKPQQLLCWCPSCDHQLRVNEDRFDSPTVRDRISVAVFLAERLCAFEPAAFAPVTPMRLAMHAHAGFLEQEADDRHVREMLTRIPGIELLDAPMVEGIGRHCSDTSIRKFGEAAYPSALRDWMRGAREAGASHVGTIYHSCHRQILLTQREFPAEERMPVVNYLSLISASLGLAWHEDKFSRFAESGDVEAILAELEPNFEQLKLPAERARRAVAAQFGRKE